MTRMNEISNTDESTSVHKGLVQTLKNISRQYGYYRESNFAKGMNPDVFLTNDWGKFFIGDAKNAKNESPDNKDTLQRINRYIGIGYNRIRLADFTGGHIGILTNKKTTAFDWKPTLENMCRRYGVLHPIFNVNQISPKTYLIQTYLHRHSNIPSIIYGSLHRDYAYYGAYDVLPKLRLPRSIIDSIRGKKTSLIGNSSDVLSRIKRILDKYNISQRCFQELILTTGLLNKN